MKKNLKTAFSTRQYMLSKDFEIYYYDDSKLLNVNDHTHDYYEFYAFVAGHVTMHIGNTAYTLQPGDILLIPPNTRHHIIVNEEGSSYQRIVFWISKEYYDQLTTISSDYGYIMRQAKHDGHFLFHTDLVTRNSIYAKYWQLLEEIHSDRFGKSAMINIYVHNLVLFLNRIAYEQDHAFFPRENQSLYAQLLFHIEEHIDEELSLDQLSTIFYTSKYHIAHVFKANLGISVHQYILKKRLSLCRAAIASQNGIADSYLSFGFKDYSSFYRAFKKEYGMSPKEYLRSIA